MNLKVPSHTSTSHEIGRELELFHLIAEATAPVTGEDFFKALLKNGAAALGVQCAFVTECVDYPYTRVRMLAQWSGGEFVDNEEYPLAGTSCEEVIAGGKVCFIAKGTQALYKNEPGVEGYFGIPLFEDISSRVIGHLAFLDEGEMTDDPIAQSILRIFSARAAAELQRLRAEQKSRQLHSDLAHVSRLSALGEMASTLAHEINQPLTAIMSYAQACLRIMQAQAEEQQELRHALQRMVVQAEAAGSVISHLRELVRRDTSQATLVDARDLIREVVQLVSAELRKHQVSLRLQLADDLPLLLVNAVHIQQVILNLIKNGVEAINAQAGDKKEIVLSAVPAQDVIQISVQDSGLGLPPQLEKMFEAFFTTKAEGLGIGLSISRSIIEAHGGRIWAVANPAGGAMIHFTLPAQARAQTDAE